MKKRLFSFFMTLVVMSLFCLHPINAMDQISTDIGLDTGSLLDETYIRYNYETKTTSTFTYGDVVESLQEYYPDFTDYTQPCCTPLEIMENASASPLSIFDESPITRVTNVNEAPYSGIVKIKTRLKDNYVSDGTGFVVGDYVVMTCAHVIYDTDNNDWVEELKIYPFIDESVEDLSSVTDYYHPQEWVIHAAYDDVPTGDAQHDWCYMTLNEPIGQRTGRFPFSTFNIALEVETSAIITGYPLRDPLITDYRPNAQYTSQGTIKAISEYRFRHKISATDGQSGAPIYRPVYAMSSVSYIVIGIYTGGKENNYGARITPSLFNLVTNKILETEGG